MQHPELNEDTELPFVNPLPGVPLIESPFFEKIFSGKAYDESFLKTARSLHRDGFAVINFPENDFDKLANGIIEKLSARFDFDSFRIGEKSGYRVQDAWREYEEVRAIAANGTILKLLERLYGRPAFPFQTLNFPFGSEQHYHSDSVHFSSMPERFMCGVWVALEDVDADNGPLIYFPGSHAWPIYGNEHIGHIAAESRQPQSQVNFHFLWQEMVRLKGVQPHYYTPKKGDALIWAANLLHGGAPHKNRARTRWSQVNHYFFGDCCYYTPLNSDLPIGSIDYRNEVTDISTGLYRQSRYLGHKILSQKTEDEASAEDRLPVGWNPSEYLAINPDVAAAGANPAEHYLKYGRLEGRKLRP